MNPRPILLTSLMALGLACGKQAESPAPTLPTVAVRLVANASPAGAGWVAATLQRTDQATLSTRLAGTVKRVLVTEGSAVASGQLLMELEAGDLLGQLKAAQSGREAAQGYHRRIKALQAQGAATPSELEQAASQLAQADPAQEGLAALLHEDAGELAAAHQGGGGDAHRTNLGAGGLGGGGHLDAGEGAAAEVGRLQDLGPEGLAVGEGVAAGGEGDDHRLPHASVGIKGHAPAHGQPRGFGLRQGGGEFQGTPAFQGEQGLPGAHEGAGLHVPALHGAREGRADLGEGELALDGGHGGFGLGERDGDQVEARAGLNRTDRVIADPAGLQDGQPVRVESAPKEDARHGR